MNPSKLTDSDNDWNGLPLQPVDATHTLKRFAGVSKSNVSRGRSFNSRAFDEKWGNPSDQTNGDELLKKADASAVCDYAEIYSNVRSVRIIPISLRGYLEQIFVLIIPFYPWCLPSIP